jgi:hypothetical protein
MNDSNDAYDLLTHLLQTRDLVIWRQYIVRVLPMRRHFFSAYQLSNVELLDSTIVVTFPNQDSGIQHAVNYTPQ